MSTQIPDSDPQSRGVLLMLSITGTALVMFAWSDLKGLFR